MRRLLGDVYIIEGIGNANVFLIGSSDGFILIDTGIFMQTHSLINKITHNGFDIKKLSTIVLTHCHCDHIGGVTELVKCSGAKVAAHKNDIPYILQEKVIEGSYHNMMIEEQRTMRRFNCDIKQVDIELDDGDIIEGLKVINVPGHTPGSIALYHEVQKIMLFGDVIRNSKKGVLTVGIPEKFNYNTQQTINDYRKLLNYSIEYALLSHGNPIMEDTMLRLKEIGD